jgi:hypothetical protein
VDARLCWRRSWVEPFPWHSGRHSWWLPR